MAKRIGSRIGSKVGLCVALAAPVVALGCGGAAHSSAAQGAATGSPASLPGLNAGDQQFVSDMQIDFSFASGVSSSHLVSFGGQVCGDVKRGASMVREVPAVQQEWAHLTVGDALQMILLAEKDICPAEQRVQTVTYLVGGSQATVMYGPADSNDQGTGPMSITEQLSDSPYYTIDAELLGGGTVSCSIKVDGVTIAAASASGEGNTAECEIDQNLSTGGWEDANSPV
jgi:hypothetical protein